MALFKRKKEKNRKPTRLEQKVKEIIELNKGTCDPDWLDLKVEWDLREYFNDIAYNILLPISLILATVGFALSLVKCNVGGMMIFIGVIMPFATIQIKDDYVEKGMNVYNQIINKKGATHGRDRL